MTRFILAAAALASCLALPAHSIEMPSRTLVRAADAPATFRAPALSAHQSVRLAPMLEKAQADAQPAGGPVRIGSVRALPKAAEVAEWTAVPGGFVTVLDLASAESAGIRARLDLAGLNAPIEIRVQGSDGRVVAMTANPATSAEAWTPFTEGETQRVELFSAQRPEAGAVRVGAVVHFTASPFEKVAGTCTVPTLCSTGDAALDAAIAERKKSVMRLNYISGGGAFLCSGTVINTDKFPAAYVLTANHCIDSAAAAGTVTTWWNYESLSCTDRSPNPNSVQIPGGTQLVFTNYNIDGSLLLMNQSPPAGAVYAGYSSAPLAASASVVSLSHPDGDTMRFALGATSREYAIIGRPQRMQGVRFTRGIIEGGSSGSGLFTLTNGNLQVRGILSGTTIREGGMSCTTTQEEGLYGALATFLPQMQQFVSNAAVAADDAPNRTQDMAGVAQEAALNGRGLVSLDGRRIDYAGDLDLYRFTLTTPATVSVWTEGAAATDTVGNILDSRGVSLEANDDAQAGDMHFGITRRLAAGTYYVQVSHFLPSGTGAYNLRMRADNLETNFTSLWWNASEPGWGININHQDNVVFATLFTYDRSGNPVWLAMTRGELGADGAYAGELHRFRGPAFNAPTTSWSAASVAPSAVGTMRIMFSTFGTAALTYTFDGTQVTKTIVRQRFGASLPTCAWSRFDRSLTENFQDLWWNPAESGWGLNVAHQDDTLFATLFTYDASGQPIWYYMSNGAMTATGTYTGALYRLTGPAFNTTPWPSTPLQPITVGTMTLRFTQGNQATVTYSVNNVSVTKQIQRQVFGEMRPSCES